MYVLREVRFFINNFINWLLKCCKIKCFIVRKIIIGLLGKLLKKFFLFVKI